MAAAEPRPRRWRPRLRLRLRLSLTARILVVNIIALGLLAASLFYIDNYRRQILAERFARARVEAEIVAEALDRVDPPARRRLLAAIGRRQHLRLRLYDGRGRLMADSFALAAPSFALADPDRQPWYQQAGRLIDRGMDAVLGTAPVPAYAEPAADRPANFPEIAEARAQRRTRLRQRYAPDRTPVITAATPLGDSGETLLSLRNSPDITQNVRDARAVLGDVVGVALVLSVLLSLFLARTIIEPLRALVRAAVRVRRGRDRTVVVPRLPDRRDEIGLLARAVSDMTAALRQRIDAVESFAADVAHEIKNPLASLRSALESLEKVEDAGLRRQLTNIAAHDVRRIDRLVTEIADASRIDAELSRATFERVDLFALASALVGARERRGANAHCTVITERRGASDGRGAMVVAGDPGRLERVFENLIDNAVSFSPEGALVEVVLTGGAGSGAGSVVVEVIDQGPGIPEAARERVFERFHSLRPAAEDFGRHSGLGLAIARTIVEAHDGTLTAESRLDNRSGARMVVTLPAPDAAPSAR